MICSSCSTEVSGSFSFCPSCGEALARPFPLTFDPTAWYAGNTILALVVAFGLAIYGFKVSLAGRPAFEDLLAEV